MFRSMEQSPSWEANSSSSSQDISRVVWNSTVHYRIHNSPPPVPVQFSLCPPNPTSWRSVLILPSHLLLVLLNGLFPSSFPHQNHVCTSPNACYTPFSFWFDHPNDIWLQIRGDWRIKILLQHWNLIVAVRTFPVNAYEVVPSFIPLSFINTRR